MQDEQDDKQVAIKERLLNATPETQEQALRLLMECLAQLLQHIRQREQGIEQSKSIID